MNAWEHRYASIYWLFTLYDARGLSMPYEKALEDVDNGDTTFGSDAIMSYEFWVAANQPRTKEEMMMCNSKNHDKHYADMAIQPIDVQEQILRSNNGMDAVQKHHLAEAVAYIMRAGLKAGQDWRKDLDKARNYLHRATTGEWQ